MSANLTLVLLVVVIAVATVADHAVNAVRDVRMTRAGWVPTTEDADPDDLSADDTRAVYPPPPTPDETPTVVLDTFDRPS